MLLNIQRNFREDTLRAFQAPLKRGAAKPQRTIAKQHLVSCMHSLRGGVGVILRQYGTFCAYIRPRLFWQVTGTLKFHLTVATELIVKWSFTHEAGEATTLHHTFTHARFIFDFSKIVGKILALHHSHFSNNY